MNDLVHLPPYSVDLLHVPHSASDGVDWAVASYGIPGLWKEHRGAGVTVAVVDTGIAPHSALSEAVIDYRNFTADTNVYDTVGHGTHVAGVIGARSGACKGVAPEVKLLSLKVLGHSGMGNNRSVAEAVRFATEAQVDLICMSLGSPGPSAEVHSAIREAHAKGVIIVCAAGNDGGPVSYPAAFVETIGVGAVDKNGDVCPFSARGKEICIAAPGQDISSTWIDNGYACLSGTSMAAPFVTGVLSLWVSAQKSEGKSVDHSKAIEALSKSCRDVGDPGKDSDYGWGLVDPHKLLPYSVPGGVTIYIPGAKVV